LARCGNVATNLFCCKEGVTDVECCSYVDPDIDAKLQALEEEEERLEAEGYYDSDEEVDDAEEADVRQKAELIREKQTLIRNEAKMRKSLKNRAMLPRKSIKRPLSELEEGLDVLGVDTTELSLRARSSTVSRGRSLSRSRMGTEVSDAMDIDATPRDRLRSKSRARSQPATNRLEDGVTDVAARTKVERVAKLGQRKMNRMARQGEADRHIGDSMPKHLVSFYISLKCNTRLTRVAVLWKANNRQDGSTIKGRLEAIGRTAFMIPSFLSLWKIDSDAFSIWCSGWYENTRIVVKDLETALETKLISQELCSFSRCIVTFHLK
jgi:hypothetical protein